MTNNPPALGHWHIRVLVADVGLPQVLPLVLELGQDIIWRVRRAVMVSVPLLTERMGVNYFEENLLELYLQVHGASRHAQE